MSYENFSKEQLEREISVYRKRIKALYEEIRILNKFLDKLQWKLYIL